MIDKEKIKDAAYDMNDGELTNDKLMRGAFMCGAKWAQEEFLKSLWHSSKEEPKEKGYIITKYFDADEKEVMYELDSIQGLMNWEEYSTLNCIMEWCYLSDILPQKGGKDD